MSQAFIKAALCVLVIIGTLLFGLSFAAKAAHAEHWLFTLTQFVAGGAHGIVMFWIATR